MQIARLILRAPASALAAAVLTSSSLAGAQTPPGAGSGNVQDRLAKCATDPRVVLGLVSQQVCAGADLFFRETFQGNGRTCATCHPSNHNFTIDRNFIATLPPSDPLFVFEQVPALAQLESPGGDLRAQGGVLENVDGFESPTTKFVIRGVPHLLSLSTDLAPDPGDGTANPPRQRTGWAGDGAPGNGTLREFATGAVIQHFTKDLNRVPGTSFRLPNDQELDLLLAFQLGLGRTNELDFNQLHVFDPDAEDGRVAYMDPMRGRCNVCHVNGGANFQDTGLNRNFNTQTARAPVFSNPFDAGFGGQGLASPNFDLFGRGVLDSFGDGTFNTAPVIEAVDTPPFFHTNAFVDSIEAAISFYNTDTFASSPAGLELTARFGARLVISNADLSKMARFLRTLNAALNLDMAKQRLQAVQAILNRFQNGSLDVQTGLIDLAQDEIDDAVKDLTDTPVVQPFYPVAQDRLQLAKSEIAAALNAASAGERAGHVSNAISRLENARDQFGSGINYTLGAGNLMF